jgi:uncharacterized membrane protein YhhN
MNPSDYLPALFLSLLMLIPFGFHYLTIRFTLDPQVRLDKSRGTYFGFSIQLLLAAWFIVMVSSFRAPLIMVAWGMTFSSLGDFFNLQFPLVKRRTSEPVFFGIISFALAQSCYLIAFWIILPVGRLVTEAFYLPLVILVPAGAALIFRFRVWTPRRPRHVILAAFMYTFFLGAMAATALSGALLKGGPWWIITAGAAFFLLSDSIMGETSIYGRHPSWEFQVPWFTYLLAQSLIIGGFFISAG